MGIITKVDKKIQSAKFIKIELLRADTRSWLNVSSVETGLGRNLLPGRCYTIGVEPCMAFEASLVAFLHDEFEGVPSGILASGIHQVGAPRLEGRAVHGVASRAHLEVDGVEVVDFQRVEQCNHLLLLFFNLGSVSCRTDHGLGPVGTPDCRHPSRAHLSVGH